MEFFSWCMAYPCPYGPCNPGEIAEWQKEQAAVVERRRSKKAFNDRPLRPPIRPPPRYSRLPCRLSRYHLSCPVCRLRDLNFKLRTWVNKQKKPYSAVSVQIDRLTSEQYEEDDLSGIIDLIEVIRIQGSGPTEAARAIRKKLKYGNAHRQIRALAILDGLIQNAGSRFQKTFADEPLLERLRLMVRDDMVDLEVRKKCNVLFRQWAVAYKDTPGLHNIATLYKQLPQKRAAPPPSKVLRETEADAQEDPSPTPPSGGHSRGHSRTGSGAVASASSNRPVTLSATPLFSSNSKSSKKKDKTAKFNLEKEKPSIMQAIAQASVASTNLLNALQLINRESQRVSENPEVLKRFETCKMLRRQILGYIQLVESDEWIGSLLSANDELVKALTSYEIMDKSLDDDSDSDAWERLPGDNKGRTGAESQLAGLNLGGGEAAPLKPPRPGNLTMPPKPDYGKTRAEPESESESEEEEDDDEDNPFGDSNAVKTPRTERRGMTWKEV